MHPPVLQYIDQASHGQHRVAGGILRDRTVAFRIGLSCLALLHRLVGHFGEHGAVAVGKLVQKGHVHPRSMEKLAGGVGRRLGGKFFVRILPQNVRGKHFSRGEIRKYHAVAIGGGIQGAQEIVSLLVEHAGFKYRACGDHTGDPPLHQALGGGGVLQLIHDGHTVALIHQLCQIGLQGVVRHAAHGGTLGETAIPPGQHQLQSGGRRLGILKEHLVEVAKAHHHKTVGVLRLYFIVLLHQGRQSHSQNRSLF